MLQWTARELQRYDGSQSCLLVDVRSSVVLGSVVPQEGNLLRSVADSTLALVVNAADSALDVLVVVRKLTRETWAVLATLDRNNSIVQHNSDVRFVAALVLLGDESGALRTNLNMGVRAWEWNLINWQWVLRANQTKTSKVKFKIGVVGESKNNLVLGVLLVQELSGSVKVWSGNDGRSIVARTVGVVVVNIERVSILDVFLVGEKAADLRRASNVGLEGTPREEVEDIGLGQVEVFVLLQQSVSGALQVGVVVLLNDVVVDRVVEVGTGLSWSQRVGAHGQVLGEDVVVGSLLGVLVAQETTSEVSGSLVASARVRGEHIELLGGRVEQGVVLRSERNTVSDSVGGTSESSLGVVRRNLLFVQFLLWNKVGVVVEKCQLALEGLVVRLDLGPNGLELNADLGGRISLTVSGQQMDLLQSTLFRDVGGNAVAWVLDVWSGTTQESDVVVRFNRGLVWSSHVSEDALAGKKKTVVQEFGNRDHCLCF